MSHRPWQSRLEDILEAIADIFSFVEGMDFERFASDKKTVRAAAYEIGVIGEAARNIPTLIQEQYPDIPWREMVGFRNIVIHEYFRVDIEVLWQTINEDLAPLVPLLQALLEEE